MSRSYRKPYASFCGSKSSAKEDKQTAARGVRHVQNYVAKLMLSDPDILMPHRLECPWNKEWNLSNPCEECESDECDDECGYFAKRQELSFQKGGPNAGREQPQPAPAAS